MKNLNKGHILSAIVALSVLASTTPAAALSLGASVNGSVSSDRSETSLKSDTNATVSRDEDRNDNGRDESQETVDSTMQARMNATMNHWKTWAFNSGITGTVTATSGNTITVKGSNGTTYTVDSTNANIRYASGSTIETGDHVYIQGATTGTTVAATLIVDGKANTATPTPDDKRSAIAGTVTAKSGTTLTVVGRNGTTYTVAAANATVWKGGSKSAATLSDVNVGDAVVIQGTLSGSSETATKIYAVTFPSTSANGGIRGTVTAVNGNTITLMGTNGTTYTVNTSAATVYDRKGKDESQKNISVGDMVVVNGDVNGTTINATAVSEAKVNRGFFNRIGNFFRHLFGKTSVESDTEATVNR